MGTIRFVFLGIIFVGCALVPGRYTYLQYKVSPYGFEVRRIDLPASNVRVEFDFEGSDSTLSEKVAQRGRPFKLTHISVLLSQKVPDITIKNFAVIQNKEVLLDVPELKLLHTSDSAIGREPFTYLYAIYDDFLIDVAHDDFVISCELWSRGRKIVDEKFLLTVEEKVSQSNKYLERFIGMQ